MNRIVSKLPDVSRIGGRSKINGLISSKDWRLCPYTAMVVVDVHVHIELSLFTVGCVALPCANLHPCPLSAAYFQRASLFSFGVHPMLLCCATLESMVKGIVKHTQTGHYREAVCLLEYIHSRFPSVGKEEQYVNLLVDIKTKVAPGASALAVSAA